MMCFISILGHFNTLRPRQNGRHFTDDVFKCVFVNENARILLKISVKFVSKVPFNNIPALILMAWYRSGDKPLSEPVKVSLLTHACICVAWLQWVKAHAYRKLAPKSIPCPQISPEKYVREILLYGYDQYIICCISERDSWQQMWRHISEGLISDIEFSIDHT